MAIKVLLLDDDSLSLEFMKIFLEEEGFQVFTAPTCAMARELYDLHKPEVVVADVELHDGSGIEFANYAKDSGSQKAILASGHSAEYFSNSGLNISNLDGVLTKPLDLSDLKVAVQIDSDIRTVA